MVFRIEANSEPSMDCTPGLGRISDKCAPAEFSGSDFSSLQYFPYSQHFDFRYETNRVRSVMKYPRYEVLIKTHRHGYSREMSATVEIFLEICTNTWDFSCTFYAGCCVRCCACSLSHEF